MALGAEDEPNDMDIVSQISSEEESADREASGSERLASSNLRRNALEVNSRSRMSLTGGLRQAWMTALRRWAMVFFLLITISKFFLYRTFLLPLSIYS